MRENQPSDRPETLTVRLGAADAIRVAARWLATGNTLGCIDTCRALIAHERAPEVLAEAWLIMGVAQQQSGRQDVAERALRQSLLLRPKNPQALNSLGILMQGRLAVSEALTLYEQSVSAEPGFAEAWYNLGNARRMLGLHTAALDAFTRVLALRPDEVQARLMLLQEKLALADWSEWEALTGEVLGALRAGAVMPPFAGLLLPDAGMDDAFNCATRWADREFGRVAEHGRKHPLTVAVAEKKRLHIGYLSADFHEHATAHLLARVLELHDRDSFRISLFAYGPDDGSSMRRRLAALPDFFDLRNLPVAAMAERIAGQGVDILVDLKGYTTAACLEVLALRPAPVQVNWLGWPGTTGMPWIDYVLVDEVICPARDSEFFAERPFRLEGCYQPNDDTRPQPPFPRNAARVPETVTLLAALHQTYKINPAVFDAWCAILRAVPDALLWLLEPRDAQAIGNLRQEAMRRGVDSERLIFAPRVGPAAHLARLGLADLWLDAWPTGSHTTASDALWAGVPVLAYAGNTFASRVSASLLGAAGLSDCVADSAEAFVAKAVAVLGDRESLGELKARAAAARTSALFDSAGFARKLEAAYRQIWHESLKRHGGD